MTKGQFLTIFNTATFLSENAFNKLGLVAKKYCNAFKDDFNTLSQEETYEVRAPFYELDENKKVKKDQNGSPIVDSTKEKELAIALSAWKKEVMVMTGSFTPETHLKPSALMISPAIYDNIQGHIINIDEELYFEIVEEELKKMGSEAETKK